MSKIGLMGLALAGCGYGEISTVEINQRDEKGTIIDSSKSSVNPIPLTEFREISYFCTTEIQKVLKSIDNVEAAFDLCMDNEFNKKNASDGSIHYSYSNDDCSTKIETGFLIVNCPTSSKKVKSTKSSKIK